MRLLIDQIPVEATKDDTLLTLLRRAGLDSDDLARKPLGAQIGGEVFTLNFTPLHEVDGQWVPHTCVVKSDGVVTLLRYSSDAGKRLYERTLQFVVLLAIERLFPKAHTCVEYALGAGSIYMMVDKSPRLCAKDVDALREECRRIIEQDLRLDRESIPTKQAISLFKESGQIDKVRLLAFHKNKDFEFYRQGHFMDYLHGEMAPSTGYVSVFDLEYLAPGMIMRLPDSEQPQLPTPYIHGPKFAAVFAKTDQWGHVLHCAEVADLNDMVSSGQIRELVRINEALHEKTYADIADQIIEKRARAVMVAGPSSAGKTTSANRLYTHLRVLGKMPVLLSLDNYYRDRDDIPVDENGERDLEHIETLDISRFQKDLSLLLLGEQVEVPIFDFTTGKRAPQGVSVQIGRDEPLIIEGIHGLNPRMIPPSIHPESIFRVYVSALTTLNLDDHNRIRTTDVRLLRRLVRDYETRNSSVEHTLSMWPSVRRGEKTWIFPFQEQADVFFNSTLVYELAVLKKHIYPLLLEVPPYSPYYLYVNSIIKFLDYFLDAHVEQEIPPTSVLREFIGGNAFYQ